MHQALHRLGVATSGPGLVEITPIVAQWVGEQGFGTGLLTAYCRHTSASLLIQENADPDVRGDLQRFFQQIAPEDPSRYAHHDEGPDDMPAHIRSALTPSQLSIPISRGRLTLGTWQGLFLFEHRSAGRRREVVLHAFGDDPEPGGP